MANKKAEILTMDGQVVSPITLATNVLLEDGRTAQDLLDSRDESMFSPTITTSSSISKVGQGDNVDFSENVIDGAYGSCVLKGKTLVNYNTEGNDRNEYVCMPSLEGSNLTVNDTVEGKVKSAILTGNTLVNLSPFTNKIALSPSNISETKKVLQTLNQNTKYILIFNINNSTSSLASNYIMVRGYNTDGAFKEYGRTIKNFGNGRHYILLESTEGNVERIFIGSDFSCEIDDTILAIYQDGMENWGIPYFEGMQSVKMPVLTTTGKNLMDINSRDVNSINYHGVTYSIDANGYYSIKGTLTSGGRWVNTFDLTKSDTWGNSTIITEDFMLKKGTYTLSACDISGETSTPFRFIRLYKKPFTTVAELYNLTSTTFTLNEDTKLSMMFQTVNYNSGDSIDVKFKVQIEKGTTATQYEPYKTNILTVNEGVTLRGIGDVKDELDLLTGELTERVGEVVLNGGEDEVWTRNISLSNDNYSTSLFTLNVKGIKRELNNGLSKKCDKFPVNPDYSHSNDIEGIHQIIDNQIAIRVLKTKLSEDSAEGFNSWLSNNPLTVQYKLLTESIKTVDLSDNVVYSYKDTTHYTCSSEEGSLLPTLTIEEGVKYKAIIKPSTKYSIVFNRTEVASGLAVDLGGATTNVVSTTKGKNIVQITTPPTLSHNYVIFKGLGNVIKDVQVIEGDVVGDEPYFEGMADVKTPVLTTTGKNLFDGKERLWFIEDNGKIPEQTVWRDWITDSYIQIDGGKKYYSNIIDKNKSFYFYDSNKNFIEAKHNITASDVLAPINAKYMLIKIAGFRELGQKVAIYEGDFVTTSYEPYKSNTVTTNEVVLRSLPNGVCDTLDLETGEYVQRIGEIVLDGSETIIEWQNTNVIDGIKAFSFRNCADNNTTNVNSLSDTYITYQSSGKLNMANGEGVSITSNHCYLKILTSKLETSDIDGLKKYLSQNPITVQYELATPIVSTIDLKQHPFAYKDGYVVLTSSSEEISLTPTIEYSLIANRLGQIQSNQKLVEKQQAQIDELESMVITNLVNTQYQQALNEIKLGVK